MDLLKYVPRGIVHSWVKRKKEKSGLNRARARRVEDRHRLGGELEDVRFDIERVMADNEATIEDNIRLVYENMNLEDVAIESQSEVLRLEGFYGAAKSVLYADKKLRQMRNTVLYLALKGPASKLEGLSKEEKDAIAHIIENGDINVNLEEIVFGLRADVVKEMERNRALIDEGFGYKMGDTCKVAGVNKVPAFGYANGEIKFATPNFERRYIVEGNLPMLLRKDVELQEALKKGKNISRVYEVNGDKKIKVVFETSRLLHKEGKHFAAASVTPLRRGGKSRGRKIRKVLSEVGDNARGVINKSAEFLYKSGLYFKQDEK